MAVGGEQQPCVKIGPPPKAPWVCSACTLINHMPLAPVCVVCGSTEAELIAEKRELSKLLRCAALAARTAARIASSTYQQPAFGWRPPRIRALLTIYY
jgi:hypothetical protein